MYMTWNSICQYFHEFKEFHKNFCQGSDDPRFRRPNPQTQYKNPTQLTITRCRPRSCPFYKQVGRNDQHFLSKCPYLAPEDRLYLTRTRSTYNTDEKEADSIELILPVEDEVNPPTHAFAWIISRRISTKYSHHTSRPFTDNAH